MSRLPPAATGECSLESVESDGLSAGERDVSVCGCGRGEGEDWVGEREKNHRERPCEQMRVALHLGSREDMS